MRFWIEQWQGGMLGRFVVKRWREGQNGWDKTRDNHSGRIRVEIIPDGRENREGLKLLMTKNTRRGTQTVNRDQKLFCCFSGCQVAICVGGDRDYV